MMIHFSMLPMTWKTLAAPISTADRKDFIDRVAAMIHPLLTRLASLNRRELAQQVRSLNAKYRVCGVSRLSGLR